MLLLLPPSLSTPVSRISFLHVPPDILSSCSSLAARLYSERLAADSVPVCTVHTRTLTGIISNSSISFPSTISDIMVVH